MAGKTLFGGSGKMAKYYLETARVCHKIKYMKYKFYITRGFMTTRHLKLTWICSALQSNELKGENAFSSTF